MVYTCGDLGPSLHWNLPSRLTWTRVQPVILRTIQALISYGTSVPSPPCAGAAGLSAASGRLSEVSNAAPSLSLSALHPPAAPAEAAAPPPPPADEDPSAAPEVVRASGSTHRLQLLSVDDGASAADSDAEPEAAMPAVTALPLPAGPPPTCHPDSASSPRMSVRQILLARERAAQEAAPTTSPASSRGQAAAHSRAGSPLLSARRQAAVSRGAATGSRPGTSASAAASYAAPALSGDHGVASTGEGLLRPTASFIAGVEATRARRERQAQASLPSTHKPKVRCLCCKVVGWPSCACGLAEPRPAAAWLCLAAISVSRAPAVPAGLPAPPASPGLPHLLRRASL